jgi:hypothetical protein
MTVEYRCGVGGVARINATSAAPPLAKNEGTPDRRPGSQ